MCALLKCGSEGLDSHLLYAWGDESHIRIAQKKYVPYFQNASGPVLDIGCERGVMLELLKTAGVQAYGVDLSHELVKIRRDRNLDAVQGGAVEHLLKLQDNSVGGLSCSHIIERMRAA